MRPDITFSFVLAEGRRCSSIAFHERSTHSTWTWKSGALRDESNGKVSVTEEALGALDTERLRDL